MIILTNKAGPSSAPFMILLLISISTVFGCGVIPGGQTSTRTFTASGPSNLPIIAVYTDNKQSLPYSLVLQPARMLFRHLHNVLQCKQSSMFSKSKVGGHSCLIL
ncbi:hypothetical protein KIN20_005407 [Parelaphostrongylus tenuis]|uniref:Uncharacterized protein n=1 Tax=Parelaphostrongylus tenuis TaxID=148309 RepID=A0AAD5M235_PARTN|nr:hypothetical protein KIN20_005407 [Parelaphostrongylus tenuis]